MEVFLSYPSERLDVARDVYTFLGSIGVSVWFDKESLIAGQEWDRERAEAQKRADLTVLICSAETIERSGVIQREVKEILKALEDKPIGEIYLISIRINDIRLPPELAKYQYVNYFDGDWRLRLARSVELKFLQRNTFIPNDLAGFFSANQLPEPYTLRSMRDQTDVLEAEAEFFVYNFMGDYWSYVNANIFALVLGDLYRAKFDLNTIAEWSDQSSFWSMKTEEFFRVEEMISLRFVTYMYASGAAHPNFWYNCINLGGQNLGKFDLNEIFANNPETLKFLRKYCELDIRKQLLAVDQEVKFFSSDDADADWKIFSEFNFDKKGLTINFSPYAILPYAFGAHEVHVPWDVIKDKIDKRFVDGPLGKIIRDR